MKIKLVVLLLLTVLLVKPTYAYQHSEQYYQELSCKGQIEFVLDDRTRVDCLTSDYAAEVDFAKKWYEAVGQSLYYAYKTGKKPKIILIVESKEELKYVNRMINTLAYHNLKIEIELVYPDETDKTN